MTRRETNLGNAREGRGASEMYSGLQGEVTPRSNSEAVRVGVSFLFSMRRDRCWRDFVTAGDESDTWVTAYVLARIGELPAGYISSGVRRQIEDSLQWLLGVRSPAGGWGYNSKSEDDADSTAWAVLALRRNRHPVPAGALELIQRCRRQDGGIAPYPEESPNGKNFKLSAPDVTAVAAEAVGTADTAATNFLNSCWLQTNKPLPPCRLASPLFTCAAVLDWNSGLASWALLDKVCDLMSEHNTETAFEQALLLRCLAHLRIQKAWSVSAGLRRMQRTDGSWPASAFLQPVVAQATADAISIRVDHERILTTATAVSALAKGEEQPGLYFGSDRPLARRPFNS